MTAGDMIETVRVLTIAMTPEQIVAALDGLDDADAEYVACQLVDESDDSEEDEL
jgi:hypothetical protein